MLFSYFYMQTYTFAFSAKQKTQKSESAGAAFLCETQKAAINVSLRDHLCFWGQNAAFFLLSSFYSFLCMIKETFF